MRLSVVTSAGLQNLSVQRQGRLRKPALVVFAVGEFQEWQWVQK